MLKSLLFRTLIVILVLPVFAQAIGNIRRPECAVFDSTHNRYLVSAWQYGDVYALSPDGTQWLFWNHSAQVLSGTIYRDTFYVSCGFQPGSIAGLNLATGEEEMMLEITGSVQIDGMASDTSGNLWVVDMNATALYRVKLSDRTFTKFTPPNLAPMPQDVHFVAANNRLLIVGYSANAPIQAYNINDGTLTNLYVTAHGFMDGIAQDQTGNYYFSCYSAGEVYRYDSAFNAPPIKILSGLGNPANISYNLRDHILVIPLFLADSLALIPYDYYQDEDNDTIPAYRDNCPGDHNPNQADGDGDAIGDACDDCTDTDGDGFGNPGFPLNTCLVDNCPQMPNPTQADADGDGLGDACCCLGVRGNVNYIGIVDLADLSALVSYLTGGGYVLPCPNEANVNRIGIVDLADLSALVSYLTGGGYVLPSCPV